MALGELTQGEMLFYGGIAGTGFFVFLFVVLWIVFERKKKKLIRKIEQEYS